MGRYRPALASVDLEAGSMSRLARRVSVRLRSRAGSRLLDLGGSSIGRLHGGDVELRHHQERLRDPVGLTPVGLSQPVAEKARLNLPRGAMPIPEPAAIVLLTSGRELLPPHIRIRLRFAGNEE